MKYSTILIAGLAFGFSSCSTNKSAATGGPAQTAMLVGGIGVMAALSPVAPVTSVIARASHPDRALAFPEVYRLPDSRFVISNYLGWFTDRSEMPPPGKGWRADSAWVIDSATSPRDNRGRIVLSEQNLVRWYFKDADRKSLQRIPAKTKRSAPHPDYIAFEPGAASLEIHLDEQTPITVYLKQE